MVGYLLFVPAALLVLLGGHSSAFGWVGLVAGVIAAVTASWGRRNLREIREFEAQSGAEVPSADGRLSGRLARVGDRPWASLVAGAAGVVLVLVGLGLMILPGPAEPKNLAAMLLAVLGGATAGLLSNLRRRRESPNDYPTGRDES